MTLTAPARASRSLRALRRPLFAGAVAALGLCVPTGCDEPVDLLADADASVGASAGSAGASGSGGAGTSGSCGSSGSAGAEKTVTIATDAPLVTSPATALGVNYWSWAPTYGANLDDTVAAIQALKPALIRMGGHNNDDNSPDPFNEAEMDRAVAYARAIGAEPILQVPLLADTAGAEPTADTAAQMVEYVNVTKQYGIKYFSIGNEPDLYSEPGQTPVVVGYSADKYCAAVAAFVPAMLTIDPSIQIVGPDLSWKYQSGQNDWLTPILTQCGASFDIIAVHRYPVDPAMTTLAAAESDAAQYKSTLASLHQKLAAAGMADKPLAITEANITYNGDPSVSTHPASPGTVPAGMWMADTIGIGLEADLWAFTPWSIREGWTLGFLANTDKRPSYYAYQYYVDHWGKHVLNVTNPSPHVHLHASRNDAGTTFVVALNWDSAAHTYTFSATGSGQELASTTVTLDATSMEAIELPDNGAARVWYYSDVEWMGGKKAPEER